MTDVFKETGYTSTRPSKQEAELRAEKNAQSKKALAGMTIKGAEVVVIPPADTGQLTLDEVVKDAVPASIRQVIKEGHKSGAIAAAEAHDKEWHGPQNVK